jgi:hypothetical protein
MAERGAFEEMESAIQEVIKGIVARYSQSACQHLPGIPGYDRQLWEDFYRWTELYVKCG